METSAGHPFAPLISTFKSSVLINNRKQNYDI